MRDGGSSTTDNTADLQTRSDQFMQLRDRVSVSVEKLQTNGYAAPFADELAKDLLRVRQSLTAFDSGFQLSKDLAVANQLVATRIDRRNVEVMHFCLQQLALYLAEVAKTGADHPSMLLTAFNELAALHKKPLLTENLFTVPDAARVDVTKLLIDSNDTVSVDGFDYLAISQTLLSIYRGENRDLHVGQLAQSFEQIAALTKDPGANCFWLVCSAYVRSVKNPAGELRPAVFKTYKDIEKVLIHVLGEGQKPVLGMQQNVDRLLCNLLCALAADTYSLPGSAGHGSNDRRSGDHRSSDHVSNEHAAAIESQFQFASVFSELNQLPVSTPQPLSVWLQSSIGVLAERLQHCAAILAEQTLTTESSVKEFLEETASLKRLLLLIGVHGARENLEEVEGTLRMPASKEHQRVTDEKMASGSTSVQLVEQQLLYQFPGIVETDIAAAETPPEMVNDANTASGKPHIESDSTAHLPASAETANAATANTATDFGNHCNQCIDVIQQALDTALGSSGNLVPDSSVVNALDKLINITTESGIDELTALLLPLSQMLIAAEDSTLNQSETLLVQEAIIAATLGIDSLVGRKPMPGLVKDVTTRVENVLTATNQRLFDSGERNSELDSFLVEAQELLPRLFELFQRLRGAPAGVSRLYTEINRLLHALKLSAVEADEQSIATVAHYLESTIVDLTQSNAPGTSAFFDLAMESIECLEEDIARLRNSEPAEDRNDLIDRLQLAGSATEARHKPSLPDFGAESESDQEIPNVWPQRRSDNDSSPAAIVEKSIRTSAPDNLSIGDAAIAKHSNAGHAGESAGVVVLGDSAFDHTSGDWQHHLQQMETHYASISNNHNQLVELQKQFEQTLQSISENTDNAPFNASFQVLAEQLQQLTHSQGVAVKKLGKELVSASALDAMQLASVLIDSVAGCAVDNNLQVQLRFNPTDVTLEKSLFDALSHALDDLLTDIVGYTIPDAQERIADGLPALATITVSVQKSNSATVIKVSDDGCGVTVQGAEFRSDNPWKKVTRPERGEVEPPQQLTAPAVWSRQIDHRVDVSGLLNVATRYGGTVAVSSDDEGSLYQLSLPELNRSQEVLIFVVAGRQLAIAVTEIESVDLSRGLDALSLAHLLGLSRPDAFDKTGGSHNIVCKTESGLQGFLVDSVSGHKRVEFDSAERILPDVPGYTGVATTDTGQLLLLLDVDYWASQRR